METTRRDFLMVGTKLLIMTAATASALEHVLAGAPDAAAPYNIAIDSPALAISPIHGR